MSLTTEVNSTPLATHKLQAAPVAKAAKKTRARAEAVARVDANNASFRLLSTTINRVVMVAAFAISFNSQMAVGQWLGLGFASFLVPLALDALLFNLALAIPVLRAMGEGTRLFSSSLFSVTCLVSALNIAHILLPALPEGVTYEDAAAAAVAALIPFVVLLTTHLELTLTLAKTNASAKTLAARQAAIDAASSAPVSAVASSPSATSHSTVPVPTSKGTTRLTDEMRTEISTLFTTQSLSVPEIAKRLGTSAPTARKVLKDAGLYEGKESI